VQNENPNSDPNNETILVVDDEETVRTIAARLLKLFGYSVLLAEDGEQGVEIFRANEEKISAVILDISMPSLNGVETLQEMRKIRAAIRVLLISGHNEQDAMEQFGDHGFDGFLQKPFKPDDLRNKLQTILGKPQPPQ
jgi:CheY-like chemotaxis protein